MEQADQLLTQLYGVAAASPTPLDYCLKTKYSKTQRKELYKQWQQTFDQTNNIMEQMKVGLTPKQQLRLIRGHKKDIRLGKVTL